MATYTSNYAWTKPSGNDQVDISVLNDNLDSQDAIMHKAFNNMAQAFSELSTYAVGDIVLYDNELYKCHTAVTVAGAWTGSTNWQVYKLSEGGGGGGTSNYNDLTNQPSINGVTLSGNKTTSDLSIDKTAVGLGNVPNVSTNDQTPTFTEASTRNNIASGEKLSVILGKIQKFFNDLKTVAFSGKYTDLTNQPQINGNTLTGNKTTSGLGINADNVMMSDGVTSVEDALKALMSDKTIADGIQPILSVGQNYGSGCYYFKIGCFIYLYISVVFDSAPNNVTIFMLPEGYKPLLGGEIIVSGGESYNAKAQCMIDSNGYVSVSSVDKYVSGSGVLLAKASI